MPSQDQTWLPFFYHFISFSISASNCSIFNYVYKIPILKLLLNYKSMHNISLFERPKYLWCKTTPSLIFKMRPFFDIFYSVNLPLLKHSQIQCNLPNFIYCDFLKLWAIRFWAFEKLNTHIERTKYKFINFPATFFLLIMRLIRKWSNYIYTT